MKNTKHTSIAAKTELQRRAKEIDYDLSIGGWAMKEYYTEEKVLKLLDALKIMIELDETMTSPLKWRQKYDIPKSNLDSFKHRFPIFKERYKDLVDTLAERMADFSLWKKVDAQTFRFLAPRYSTDFTLLEEWRAKLKEDENKTPPVIIVRAAEIPTDKESK